MTPTPHQPDSSIDIEALRKAAEAAEKGGEHIYTHGRDSNKYQDNMRWHRAASPEVFLALLDRLERAEAKTNYERKPDNSQEWACFDGATAWHLIERHADDWSEIGNMMESWLAARASRSPAGAAVPEDARSVIEEAAQVLKSAAAHNRKKGRTVVEFTQQDRANRLRAILAAPAAPSAHTEAAPAQGLPAAPDDPDDDPAFLAWFRDHNIGQGQKWIAWGAWCAGKALAPPAAAPSDRSGDGGSWKRSLSPMSKMVNTLANGGVVHVTFEAPAAAPETCQCPACLKTGLHASDCAVHSAPAYPNGPCDCRAPAAAPSEPVAWHPALKAAADVVMALPLREGFDNDQCKAMAITANAAILNLKLATPPAQDAGTGDAKEVAEEVAREVIDHIDTMYPAMWGAVAKTARTSIRNTIINQSVRFIRAIANSGRTE